jgi:hypothetical protein
MALLGAFYGLATVVVVAVLMPRTAGAVPPPLDVPPEADAVAPREVAFADAVRSPVLWTLVGAFVLFSAAQIGATTHIVRMATDRGIDAGTWLLPVVTLAALGGRLIASIALPRLSLWTVVGGVFVVEALANLTLGFAGSVGPLVAGGVLLGIAIGHTPVVQPLSLVDAFGVKDYAKIASLFQLLSSLGLGSGPLLVSLVHDGGGGYTGGYLTLVGCACAAVVVLRLSTVRLRHELGSR